MPKNVNNNTRLDFVAKLDNVVETSSGSSSFVSVCSVCSVCSIVACVVSVFSIFVFSVESISVPLICIIKLIYYTLLFFLR